MANATFWSKQSQDSSNKPYLDKLDAFLARYSQETQQEEFHSFNSSEKRVSEVAETSTEKRRKLYRTRSSSLSVTSKSTGHTMVKQSFIFDYFQETKRDHQTKHSNVWRTSTPYDHGGRSDKSTGNSEFSDFWNFKKGVQKIPKTFYSEDRGQEKKHSLDGSTILGEKENCSLNNSIISHCPSQRSENSFSKVSKENSEPKKTELVEKKMSSQTSALNTVCDYFEKRQPDEEINIGLIKDSQEPRSSQSSSCKLSQNTQTSSVGAGSLDWDFKTILKKSRSEEVQEMEPDHEVVPNDIVTHVSYTESPLQTQFTDLATPLKIPENQKDGSQEDSGNIDKFLEKRKIFFDLSGTVINVTFEPRFDLDTYKPRMDKTAILYGDNLIEELLHDKVKLQIDLDKTMKNVSNYSTNEVLAQTYIKKYRRNGIKIFKIQQRIKEEPKKSGPIDDFLHDIGMIVKIDDSTDSEEDDQRPVTPASYITDNSLLYKSGASADITKNRSQFRNVLGCEIDKLTRRSDLLFSRFSDTVPQEVHKEVILNKIQKVILNILEEYEKGNKPCIRYPRDKPENYEFLENMYHLRKDPTQTIIRYGNGRFSLLLFILNKTRTLIETGVKLPKREIYYQLKTMIKNQPIVDRAIKNVSRILGVGPWALNITAQKGLIFGNLKLVMNNGETINCNVPGTHVPLNVTEISEIHSNARFILVVEKESIFHKLREENLASRLPRLFILVTGKGFPDLSTQLLLKKLWMVMTIPVFVLVDPDPEGIQIMLTYRFGSMTSAYLSEHLAIPKLKWIGVYPTEIDKLQLYELRLTRRDRQLVDRQLQLECVKQHPLIAKELKALRKSGYKAGIESLIKTDNYLSNNYLTVKFHVQDFI